MNDVKQPNCLLSWHVKISVPRDWETAVRYLRDYRENSLNRISFPRAIQLFTLEMKYCTSKLIILSIFWLVISESGWKRNFVHLISLETIKTNFLFVAEKNAFIPSKPQKAIQWKVFCHWLMEYWLKHRKNVVKLFHLQMRQKTLFILSFRKEKVETSMDPLIIRWKQEH